MRMTFEQFQKKFPVGVAIKFRSNPQSEWRTGRIFRYGQFAIGSAQFVKPYRYIAYSIDETCLTADENEISFIFYHEMPTDFSDTFDLVGNHGN